MNPEKSAFTLQNSFWNEPREWINKIEIKEFIDLKPFREYFFPEAHINKDNQISSETLYCFNGLNISNGDKILHHLYSLFPMICDEVVLSFPSANVDLYYNETKSEHLALTVKFVSNINPSGSSKYFQEVRKGFMNLFVDDFICNYFEMLFSRKLSGRKLFWGIPKHLSIFKTYSDYGGFVYYL